MSRRWLGLTWRSVRTDLLISDEPNASIEFFPGQCYGWCAHLSMEDIEVCGFARTLTGAKRDLTKKLRMLGRLVK